MSLRDRRGVAERVPTPALQFYPPVSLQLQTHLHPHSVRVGLQVSFLHIPKHPFVGAPAACRVPLSIVQPCPGQLWATPGSRSSLVGTGARAARDALHRHAGPTAPREEGLRERRGLVEPTGGGQPRQGFVLPALYPKTREWHREKPGSERQSRGVGLAVPHGREEQPGVPSWQAAQRGYRGWGC